MRTASCQLSCYIDYCGQEYIRRGKESVVLRIAASCKRALKSAMVKLRNTTQNIPQMSSVVTASTRMAVQLRAPVCAVHVCGGTP